MNKYIAFFLAVVVIIIVGVIFGLSRSEEPKKLEEPQPTGAVRITNPLVKIIPQEKVSQEDDGNVNTPRGVLIEAAVKFSFKDDEEGKEKINK